MANHYSDAGAARNQRDLDEAEALPADLQPLYRRLSDDGAAWQAASAGKIAALAQSLVADIERMTTDGPLPVTPSPSATEVKGSERPLIPPRRGEGSQRRRMREWIAGTVAAVVVVALLALALQGALASRINTGPTTTTRTGRWQILDTLTWRRISTGQMLPIIAPSDPQVVYEAIDPVSYQQGYPGIPATAPSLRRTDDSGKSWRDLSLPLPDAHIASFTIRVSPLQPQTVFLSVWDLSSDACGPDDAVAGLECQRGYFSLDGGATWRKQKLPVPGVLDTGATLVGQDGRLYASVRCEGDDCAHLLSSGDGGLTWNVIDGAITTSQQRLCDFTATATGQTVYAAASRASCAQAPTETQLWRSDDAGAHWIELGPFQSDIQDQQVYPNGTLLTAPGTKQPDLLYRNEAMSAGNSSNLYFRYSQDKGVTWKSTPAVPAVPTTPPDPAQVQRVGSAAALSDGSLFFVPDSPTGSRITPYLWKPGAKAWQALPQLPAAVATPGGIIVTPGANGHDTITMALRANGDAANPIAYYVVRYQI